MKNQEEQWLLDEKYKGVESKAFHTDVAYLHSGTPLAYLIGSIPFLGCTIYLDSHPLIPRTETEFWTEKAISTICNYKRKDGRPYVRVLDLCAGSGAIGVAVAKEIPEASITFGEIDSTHLSTIEKNLKENTVTSKNIQHHVIQSDLYKNIEGTFDFILTNPPYIDPSIDRTEKSVTVHEPHLALYGGNEGMECIKKIIEQSAGYLSQNGQLWIEHEPEQKDAIQLLAKEHNFLSTSHCDQYGVCRYTILVIQ